MLYNEFWAKYCLLRIFDAIINFKQLTEVLMNDKLAICPKCNKLIGVDSSEEAIICPECKKAIIVEKAIEMYEKIKSSANAICPKCGAALSIDESQDAEICEKCHKPFVTASAIQTFKIMFPSKKASTSKAPIQESPREHFNYCGDGAIDMYEGPGGAIVIPSDVTYITEFTFSSCDEIESVVIPHSVKWIGDEAFSECEGLTSITIPSSVIEIGDNCFTDCHNLKEIIFESTDGWYVGSTPISVSSPREIAEELTHGKYTQKKLIRKKSR